VRIPDGDLAPARRRRYGGSYGRRRRRRNRRIALALLLVAIAAGAAYQLRKADNAVPRQRTTLTTCPTPSASPATQQVVLPKPQQIRVALLNGTPRNGLAKTVGDRLKALGFLVPSQGNAPAGLAGASTVTYGPGGQPAGTVVSRWVLGSRLVSNPNVPHGVVQVVLGSGFVRLATPTEAAVTATPAPASASPTPSGCPT
jgi:hypothetical protein